MNKQIDDLNIPDEVKRALKQLTLDEMTRLTYAVSHETGEYIGLGFIEHGKFTKPTNPERVALFSIIDAELRREFSLSNPLPFISAHYSACSLQSS